MNRFAVSMSIFVVLAGSGAFLAYRSGVSTFQAKEAVKEKVAEEAKKAQEAQAATQAASGGKGGVTEVQVSGNVKNGDTIYSGNCLGCHMAGAVGGVGPKLAKSEVVSWTLDQFKTTMLEGKTPNRVLGATMPRWKGGFGATGKPPTDQELADLHSYLKSL